jgi:methyl-accepting chemotaxis protein
MLGLSALLLLFLLVVGLMSVSKLSSVASESQGSYDKVTVPLAELGEARALVNENRALTNNHILETDPAQQRRIEAKIAANAQSIDSALAGVRKTLVTPEGKATFTKLQADNTAYRSARAGVIERSNDPKVDAETAFAYNKATAIPAVAKVQADYDKLFASKVDLGEKTAGSIHSSYTSSRTLIVALLLIALAAGTALTLIISGAVRKSLATVVDRLGMLSGHCAAELGIGLQSMAEGDLTYEVTPITPLIDHWSNDEIGDVAQSTNKLRNGLVGSIEAYNASRGQLGELVGQVTLAANSVSAGSQQMAATSGETGRAVSEIAHAIGDVASGAERQVLTIESARAAAEQVSSSSEASAVTAQETADAAGQTRAIAVDGASAIGEATAAMTAVRDASQQATTAIRALGAKSDQIGGIVDTIGGIAEQTNLLALNAAIEAARAGEQGRGFAVVAEEVRKLAEESQQAARSIAELVHEIQAETGRAVEVVEAGSARTDDGAATVEKAREAFEAIGVSVDDVTSRVEQIATVIQEVATAANSMKDDMTEVAGVAEASSAATEEVSASTQQTSAAAQQISASAAELAGTASELEGLVQRFKVTA